MEIWHLLLGVLYILLTIYVFRDIDSELQVLCAMLWSVITIVILIKGIFYFFVEHNEWLFTKVL